MVFIIVQFGTEEGSFKLKNEDFKDYFKVKFEELNVKKELEF